MKLTRLPVKHLALALLFVSVLFAVWYTYRQTTKAFAAEGLDLVIDNTSYYNGEISPNTSWSYADLDDGNGPSAGQYLFFNFTDVKPGDVGEDTIGISAQGSDYYACVDLRLTADDENTANEPELTAGDTPDTPSLFDGELGNSIQFLFWVDDGDNVFETEEVIVDQGNAATVLDNQWTLADTNENIFTGNPGPLLAGTNYYIAKAWCFGDLTPAPLIQDESGSIRTPIDPEGPGILCSGETQTNMSQTDALTAEIEFLAIQSQDNPDYSCGDCQIVGDFGADTVVNFLPASKKNGDPVNADRLDPTAALGLPEGNNNIGTFTSLGFGGTITLSFNQTVPDNPGNDITIREVTNGTYPLESANVQVSQNGSDFISIGTATNNPNPVTQFDINGSGLPWIKYLRLTDTSDQYDHDSSADGFDLDGIIVEMLDICN